MVSHDGIGAVEHTPVGKSARALLADVAVLRADIDAYRAELHAVLDEFLVDQGAQERTPDGAGGLPTDQPLTETAALGGVDVTRGA